MTTEEALDILLWTNPSVSEDLPEDVRKALAHIRLVANERDELETKASHLQHDLFYEERGRKKAEAELEKARPLLLAIRRADVVEVGEKSHFIQESDIILEAMAYRRIVRR